MIEIPKDAWTVPANVHPVHVAWRIVRTSVDEFDSVSNREYARDGILVDHYVYGDVYVNQPGRAYEQCTDLDATLARLDRESPPPVPGIREGQIWWVSTDLHGVSLRWRAVSLHGSHLLAMSKGRFSPFQWSLGGLVTEDEAALERSLADCVLLHDPLCPDRAPWSRHPIVRT